VVDLSLRASNAKMLASDLITAVIDADLTLRGPLYSNPALGGTVRVRTAEIRVPEKLPTSIAVLPVREAGKPPPPPEPPPPPAPDIALNLTLDAPGQIYVRGRGLDAELGGRVTFTGTAAQPLTRGDLNLRRGTFSLAGQSLDLTEGTIDFSGGTLTNPPIKLVATSSSGNFTSTLTISGEVRNPKIALTSVPDLPQDEILSQLLFKTAKSRLNPFQVAQIAAALASLTGIGPSIGDPLGGVRSALGLDQLGVGSDASGGTGLQAGRYLAPGVRVGVSQSATGTGTQATVQIDIAKGLKLETTAGTGSATATGAAGASNGTGVGVTYEFEY
jgi:translocation and assembly module TamB